MRGDTTERLGEAQRLSCKLAYTGIEIWQKEDLWVAQYHNTWRIGATPAGALTLLAQDLAGEIARMAQAQNAALAVALEDL